MIKEEPIVTEKGLLLDLHSIEFPSTDWNLDLNLNEPIMELADKYLIHALMAFSFSV